MFGFTNSQSRPIGEFKLQVNRHFHLTHGLTSIQAMLLSVQANVQ